MLKADYKINLWIYMNISCICELNTANGLKSGQQLLGLALRVKSWLRNPALCRFLNQRHDDLILKIVILSHLNQHTNTIPYLPIKGLVYHSIVFWLIYEHVLNNQC